MDQLHATILAMEEVTLYLMMGRDLLTNEAMVMVQLNFFIVSVVAM